MLTRKALTPDSTSGTECAGCITEHLINRVLDDVPKHQQTTRSITMRTLKASHWDSRDFAQDETFTFSIPHPRRGDVPRTGYILDCDDEGLILMQKSAMLKSHYTEADHADRARLNAMTPIKSGDIVLVNGKQYTVTIKGDYSNAGILTPA